MEPLPYYCVGHRAANFGWFAKSLGTLRRYNPDIPVVVLCDRDMKVDDPNTTVYRWPMRTILDSMIARAFILEVLPKAPESLLYLDTDTAFCQPLSVLIRACPLPGFWATVEPKGGCYIGSNVSGQYAMTGKEIEQATAHHQGSVCSGVWYTDVDTAAKLFKTWTVETYKMAARYREMVERGDWQTGDQATLNAIVFRGQLKVNAADWRIMRPFSPPYHYYNPSRAPVISHFSGDGAVKRNIWTYPGDPVKLQFLPGENPVENKKEEKPVPVVSHSEPGRKLQRAAPIPIARMPQKREGNIKIALVTAAIQDDAHQDKTRERGKYKPTDFTQIVARSRPTHEAYAKQLGIDYRILTSRCWPEISVLYEKFQIWRLFEYEKYDRILFVDADVLIRPDTCDLFDLVPEGKLGVFNEGFEKDLHARWILELMVLGGGKPRGWVWDGWYVNTGVMILDRIHRDIFKDKPVGPQAHFRWGDQGYVNWYLQTHGGIPLYRLPKELNWMPMANPGISIAEVARRAYIVHVSAFPLATRLRIMDEVLAEWSSPSIF